VIASVCHTWAQLSTSYTGTTRQQQQQQQQHVKVKQSLCSIIIISTISTPVTVQLINQSIEKSINESMNQ